MRQNARKIIRRIFVGINVLLAANHALAEAGRQNGCHAVQQGKLVELCSPFFVFRLDTTAGLRAQSWENRLTGQTIKLGNGPELDFDIGLPGRPLQTPPLEVSAVQVQREGEAGAVVFTLSAKQPAISASVTYRWDAKQPLLRKFAEIVNQGSLEWNRLLNVRLGAYRTNAKITENGQGFPAYLNDECFLSLAHPAGWATTKDGLLSLRQYPGIKVSPGKRFECMEAVYGVAKAGEARKRFIAQLRSRMRRVVRGHDKAYAIFETFGSWPTGEFACRESYALHCFERLAASQKATGCRFDATCLEFWVDAAGDLKRCDPQRFPNGFTKIKSALDQLGTALGLWIDSSRACWSIGDNPAVQNTLNWGADKDPSKTQYGMVSFCRATEPIKSMYTEAFRYHIRHNGARLLKFDDFATTCDNPTHAHLPGIYSTEPIMNAGIEFLQALDKECPDVFLILYWGYSSPWWLLYGDTLFDSGLHIEAASPSDLPAPYARDSVTQKVDQAQWQSMNVVDIPVLGKDSLGIWLSSWGVWNSQIGKDHWQGGFVMDMSRGSLLAQIWADNDWLSPPEWKELADFIALLRAQPGCFANPRFVLGSPWKNEPYGYCCTDGKRAFLALHNSCWKDSLVPLELGSAWGLPDGQTWDVYRWYPQPARLQGNEATFGHKASIALRPFEIVLLEVVPYGQPASLHRNFESRPIPVAFAEASRPIDISIAKHDPPLELESTAPWTVLEPVEMKSTGGSTLTKLKDGSILAGGKNPPSDTYTITAQTDLTGITAIRLETMTDPSLPMKGPGRGGPSWCLGNFVLDEFSVKACPRGKPAAATAVALENAVADCSQLYADVAAAIDGNPKTRWGISPCEGLSHTAIFHTRQPLGNAGGTTLQFTMQQGSSPFEHCNLGRFRLSVTTAKPPIAAPKPVGQSLAVAGQVPASRAGGTLVVYTQMSKDSALMSVSGPGKLLSGKGKLAGQPVVWQPALGTLTYPSSWQSWRVTVEPSAQPRAFELEIATTFSTAVELKCRGYFLPK